MLTSLRTGVVVRRRRPRGRWGLNYPLAENELRLRSLHEPHVHTQVTRERPGRGGLRLDGRP